LNALARGASIDVTVSNGAKFKIKAAREGDTPVGSVTYNGGEIINGQIITHQYSSADADTIRLAPVSEGSHLAGGDRVPVGIVATQILLDFGPAFRGGSEGFIERGADGEYYVRALGNTQYRLSVDGENLKIEQRISKIRMDGKNPVWDENGKLLMDQPWVDVTRQFSADSKNAILGAMQEEPEDRTGGVSSRFDFDVSDDVQHEDAYVVMTGNGRYEVRSIRNGYIYRRSTRKRIQIS